MYAFSDVLCYVADNEARDFRSIAVRMIIWADNVHHTSLNQSVRPRAVLILNKLKAFSVGDANEQSLTQRAEERLKTYTDFDSNSELRDIVTKWRLILPETEQITSVMDLFLRYFKSLSVLYIPQNDGSRRFVGQVRRLRNRLYQLTDEVVHERYNQSSLMNSELFESVLYKGLEFFFTKFGEPFDFYKAIISHKPLPQNLAGYAESLMLKIREKEKNSVVFDKRCIKLFASYRTIMMIVENIAGVLIYQFL